MGKCLPTSNTTQTLAADVSKTHTVAVLDTKRSGGVSGLRWRTAASLAWRPIAGRVTDVVHILVRPTAVYAMTSSS